MLIKQQALASQLQKKLAAVYILIGQDHYLLNKAAESIKLAWQAANTNESEETILPIDTPSDWTLLAAKANSYSLFSSSTLIDIRYEKKSLEPKAKEFLTHYLQDVNPSSLLLLRAPNLTTKPLQGLIDHDCLQVVQANPLNELAMQNWIATQLQQKALQFEPQIPALISQYTQGNMLACAQVIEKLALIANEDTVFTIKLVQEQLVDQCDYQLFELADACLAPNPAKALQLLRHACNGKVEPSLILWLLTQEIRLLIQLIELTNYQSLSFNAACSQLKIWPQRAKLYQLAVKKAELTRLLPLLQFCKTIDERIKSNQTKQIWQALEQIALSLCLAKQVGSFA